MSLDPEVLEQAQRTQEIVEQIEPILAGKGEADQGAVIAALLSTYLAGIQPIDPKDEKLAEEFREARLEVVIKTMRKLLVVDAAVVRRQSGIDGGQTH